MVSPPATAGASPTFGFQGLSFSVDGRTILEGASGTLAQGRVCGLVGNNGSGKSTLLKLLARQLRPGTGEARLGERAVTDWHPRDFARHVAYLPQSLPPASGLFVRELVALGRYPWHGALGRFGPADGAAAEDAMRRTQVAGLSERLVDTLSGGERQRAWLAMLLAQGAGYMLLDEPTSALDIGHQLRILDLVRSVARQGAGVIVVLHDINMAARFCDDLIALRDGRIVRQGPVEGLMTPDTLEAVYGVTMTVLRHPDTGAPVALAR